MIIMTKITCYCSLTVIMMTVLKFEALHFCMNKQFQKRDLLDIWSLLQYTPNKNNPNKKVCADLSHLSSLASVINLLLDLSLQASDLLNLLLELLPLAVPHLGFLSHTFLPLGCLLLGSCWLCCTQLCCLHLSPYLGILCLQPLHLSICFVHLIIFFVISMEWKFPKLDAGTGLDFPCCYSNKSAVSLHFCNRLSKLSTVHHTEELNFSHFSPTDDSVILGFVRSWFSSPCFQ